MNQRNNTYALIFSGLAIAVNIVLGTVIDMLSIPLLFLDTVGTIFTAAFIPRITSNLVDKIASCIMVAFLIQRLPKRYIGGIR
ncbi:hypothetical protein [Tissierella praeacuta]|uniref:hypothetical protein n=1 Tax=Tissierella praeacuta TaxID=43131 RepID=UPI003342C44B